MKEKIINKHSRFLRVDKSKSLSYLENILLDFFRFDLDAIGENDLDESSYLKDSPCKISFFINSAYKKLYRNIDIDSVSPSDFYIEILEHVFIYFLKHRENKDLIVSDYIIEKSGNNFIFISYLFK